MKKIKVKPENKKGNTNEFKPIDFLNLYKTRIVNIVLLLTIVVFMVFGFFKWNEDKNVEAFTLINQANSLFYAGKYDAALEIYEDFFKKFSKNKLIPLAYLGAAYCYEQKGDLDKARDAFSRIQLQFANSIWYSEAVNGLERLSSEKT